MRLNLGLGKKHVHLKLHHITQRIAANLSPVAVDLLEISAYVYAADQLAGRGGQTEFEYGQKWRRHFRFEIHVRCPEIWSDPKMLDLLKETLGFLSDDDYEFNFLAFKSPPLLKRYLFDCDPGDEADFEEVMLFSGGLDSLGGAIQEIIQGQRKIVLVSHRPSPKLYARQKRLVQAITDSLPDKSRQPLHVAVEVNTFKNFGRESTQRSRSFLFASIAAVVAAGMGKSRIRFYENGVTSLNLPISPQVVGGRATRSTHPKVLSGFQAIFGRAFGKPFTVENPYQSKAKVDILREIKVAGLSKLCAQSSSCAHTWEQTKLHSHCGYCSQCVDRRLNALAAGFDNDEDPACMYKSDVITGGRIGSDFVMIERYWGNCLEIDQLIEPDQLMEKFPELARAIGHLGRPIADAVIEIFNLIKRHACEICATLVGIVRNESVALVKKNYPPNSLLGIVVGRAQPDVSQEGNSPQNERNVAGGGPSTNLIVDEDHFSISFQGKHCELRNTHEFALMSRFANSPGVFIPNGDLKDDIWGRDDVNDNTVQRTVSSLRRRLRESNILELVIDGKTNRGHYALKLP